MRIPPLPEALDNYAGWWPSSPDTQISRVSSKITPQDMWEQYVSQRRPVVLDGHLTDPEWQGSKWTNLDYLRQKAGKVPVKIEPVHPSAGHFGTSAKRKQVPFADYVDLLEDPESAGNWYLTTQYTEDEQLDKPASDLNDNEPEQDTVLPSPTNALSNDFPKSPELLGSLVLQQCNLWLGNSKEGKSSGLHHDFHDNLYILLSGYKRFLLFPPPAHRCLQPRGLVDRVHPNGLIVYAPPGQLPSYLQGGRAQMPIRPDGLVPSDAARWRRKSRLRVKRMIDEQAATDAGEGPRDEKHWKGKAKQTRAQELAEEALQQAEMELRLCRMDEEGVTEAELSYDDDEDDDEEEEMSGDADSVNGAQDDFTTNSAEPDSDDSEDEQETQKVLDSLPIEMKSVAMLALRGDKLAAENLREYLTSLTDGSTEEESQEDQDVDPAEQHAVAHDLAGQKDDTSQSGSESVGDESDDEDAVMSQASRKRNIDARTELSDGQSDSDASDSSDPTSAYAKSGKKVKIASLADEIPRASDSEDTSGSGSEADGMPLFPEGDSGSEFGDIDAGEAELENFLAASGAANDDGDSEEEEEEDEPPSFSRIPPSVLHEHYGIQSFTAEPTTPKTHNSTVTTAAHQSSLFRCPKPIEVLLLPGQMLYLPASWYHEVTSSSSLPRHLSEMPKQKHELESSKVHMALNYWFHPPDALDFEPVEIAPSSSTGQNGDHKEPVVPGIGANIGQSAIENLRGGTGTHDRPYRDAEVWDEVARAVDEQFEKAKQEAPKWAAASSP